MIAALGDGSGVLSVSGPPTATEPGSQAVATTEDMVSKLGAIDLFAGLSPKVLRRIQESGEEQQFPPGALVTEEGASVAGLKAFSRTGVFFHLVLSGSGTVRKDGGFIGDVHPGDYFGELSLIDGLPRSADVIASEEGLTTFAIPKWTFEALLEEHPEVAMPMLKVVCARLRASEARNTPAN